LNQVFREHIIAEMAKTKVEINSSSEPLEIAAKFKRDCVEYSRKMHLDVFRD
jgi:hypothetical protein